MKNQIIALRSSLLEKIIFTAKPLIELLYKPSQWPYTQEDLRHFPKYTLGQQMALHLDKCGFQLVPHYEAHDAKHVVLGYPMTAEGEVLMQFFLFGNGNRFISVLATMLVGVLLMPDQWINFYHAFVRGYYTPVNVSALEYETLLLVDVTELQKSIFYIPTAIPVLL